MLGLISSTLHHPTSLAAMLVEARCIFFKLIVNKSAPQNVLYVALNGRCQRFQSRQTRCLVCGLCL